MYNLIQLIMLRAVIIFCFIFLSNLSFADPNNDQWKDSEKTYFDGFQCWEYTSTDVATPISHILAALASEAIKRNGTPVVITLLSFGLGVTSVRVWAFKFNVINNNKTE